MTPPWPWFLIGSRPVVSIKVNLVSTKLLSLMYLSINTGSKKQQFRTIFAHFVSIVIHRFVLQIKHENEDSNLLSEKNNYILVSMTTSWWGPKYNKFHKTLLRHLKSNISMETNSTNASSHYHDSRNNSFVIQSSVPKNRCHISRQKNNCF